jgi:site-specific DNA recombinase
MDAVGYARISTLDQSQNSIPGQVADITSYCQRNKLNLHKIFIENGQSAFNFNRKEWKDLEQYLKSHKQVKYLVIASLDRFSRANLVDALQKMDDIQKRVGVKILTVSDPVGLDIEDFGVDLRRIMELMFSNYELKKIRKRTSDGLYQSMSVGRWVNKAPFGYRNTRDHDSKPILAIDEEKAFVVRMIFRQYLSGMGLEEIRKHACANGMKLKSGSAMRRILSNPLYAGLIQLPKHGYNTAQMIPAIHPPIVSEADYWAVQENLNKKTRGTQRSESVYLKGALYCDCGRLLSSDKAKGKSGKYYSYYVCKTHRKNYSAIKLHKQMDQILDLLSIPEGSIKSIEEKLRVMIEGKLDSKGGDIMRTKLSLKKVQDRITATQERYLSQSDIPEKVYKKVIGDLKADEMRLHEQLAELSSTTSNYYEILHELLPKLSNTRQMFQDMDLQRKAAFLNLIFGHSLFYKEGIFRTPYLHFLFKHNELTLKEKGLLLIQQPSVRASSTLVRSRSGSLVEHLQELWQIFAA